jgi:hypothetical protein
MESGSNRWMDRDDAIAGSNMIVCDDGCKQFARKKPMDEEFPPGQEQRRRVVTLIDAWV